jgi:hypothetical protein
MTFYSLSSKRGRRGGGGGGGGGGMFGRSKPAAPARAPAKPTTPATTKTAAPAQSAGGGGGMMSGLASTVASGMAFGTGSAIAHQAVGAIMGGGSSSGGGAAPAEAAPVNSGFQQQDMNACGNDKTMFFECLQQNKGDQESCKFLYTMLQDCQRNQSQFASM